MRWLQTALVGLLALPSAAQAAPQDPQAVNTAIRQALGHIDNSSATLGPMMGAKFMQSCADRLAVTITGVAPFEQAAVHCTSPAWTLYVSVTVDQHATIAVTTRPVAVGQTLQSADVSMQSEPVTSYAGQQVFYDADKLAGATAVMNLPAGMILTTSNIAQPLIVRAGQSVAVNIISGDVQVSLTAIATQAGRVGDTILLTNPSTGKHFTALVTPAGPVVNLAF
ncbi:MAG: flagellar basal body P-ring formation chaperone FlgA [Acidocella sp.]|nr:flagellar basal body P-ring formation chaperone FlgA [Acidocella sp.]